jgi:structural maintenance of chromosome 1
VVLMCLVAMVGVYGRMTDLAEVTNRKYNMALSVLLGRHMDSVAVDTDKTARDCVAYLKQHRIFAMTFIPLQNLKAGSALSPKTMIDYTQNTQNKSG